MAGGGVRGGEAGVDVWLPTGSKRTGAAVIRAGNLNSTRRVDSDRLDSITTRQIAPSRATATEDPVRKGMKGSDGYFLGVENVGAWRTGPGGASVNA